MSEEIKVKVTDKRHWVNADENGEITDEAEDNKRVPTYVEKLEREAADHDAKLKEYIAAYKAKMAENDEFRARLQKDVDRRVETGVAEIMKQLIPVIDNFDLAIDSAKGANNPETLIEGMLMIKSGLLNVLNSSGMEEVDCLGEEFDPSVSEAVAVENVDDKEKDNKVLAVFQPGYKKGGMLLRPARVKVGKMAGN